MITTATYDLAEWRSRLAHALRGSLNAIDARMPAAEVTRLRHAIHAIEREGQAEGYMPALGTPGEGRSGMR